MISLSATFLFSGPALIVYFFLSILVVIEVFGAATRWTKRLDDMDAANFRTEKHAIEALWPVYAVVFAWLLCVSLPTVLFGHFGYYIPATGGVFVLATLFALVATQRQFPTIGQMLFAKR